jgi:hypothetical protein
MYGKNRIPCPAYKPHTANKHVFKYAYSIQRQHTSHSHLTSPQSPWLVARPAYNTIPSHPSFRHGPWQWPQDRSRFCTLGQNMTPFFVARWGGRTVPASPANTKLQQPRKSFDCRNECAAFFFITSHGSRNFSNQEKASSSSTIHANHCNFVLLLA